MLANEKFSYLLSVFITVEEDDQDGVSLQALSLNIEESKEVEIEDDDSSHSDSHKNDESLSQELLVDSISVESLDSKEVNISDSIDNSVLNQDKEQNKESGSDDKLDNDSIKNPQKEQKEQGFTEYNMDSVFDFSIADEMGSINQANIESLNNDDSSLDGLSQLYQMGESRQSTKIDSTYQQSQPLDANSADANSSSLPSLDDAAANTPSSKQDKNQNQSSSQLDLNDLTLNDIAKHLGKRGTNASSNTGSLAKDDFSSSLDIHGSSQAMSKDSSLEELDGNSLLQELPDIQDSDFSSQEFTDKISPLSGDKEESQEILIDKSSLNKSEDILSDDMMMESQNFNLTQNSLLGDIHNNQKVSDDIDNSEKEQPADISLNQQDQELDPQNSEIKDEFESKADDFTPDELNDIYTPGDSEVKLNSEAKNEIKYQESKDSKASKISMSASISTFAKKFGNKKNAGSSASNLRLIVLIGAFVAVSAFVFTKTPVKHDIEDFLEEYGIKDKIIAFVDNIKGNNKNNNYSNSSSVASESSSNKKNDADIKGSSSSTSTSSSSESTSSEKSQNNQIADSSDDQKIDNSQSMESKPDYNIPQDIYSQLPVSQDYKFNKVNYPKPVISYSEEEIIKKMESSVVWHQYELVDQIRKYGLVGQVAVLKNIIDQNKKLWLSLSAISALLEFSQEFRTDMLQEVLQKHRTSLLLKWIKKFRSAKKIPTGESIIIRSLIKVGDGKTRKEIIKTLSFHPTRLNKLYILAATDDNYLLIKKFSKNFVQTIAIKERDYLHKVLLDEVALNFEESNTTATGSDDSSKSINQDKLTDKEKTRL